MSKIIMVICAAVALIQIIKPLGWPGLKRRQDAWKLVLVGAAASLASVAVASLIERAVS